MKEIHFPKRRYTSARLSVNRPGCSIIGRNTNYPQVFRSFPQSIQASSWIISYIMPRRLPSTIFQFNIHHYSNHLTLYSRCGKYTKCRESRPRIWCLLSKLLVDIVWYCMWSCSARQVCSMAVVFNISFSLTPISKFFSTLYPRSC
jgi:hypothetical protein